jgi:hypothetical protein
MCAFLALERQKPGLHGRAVFLYPRSGYKNTTSQAFRCNLFAAGRQKGFPLQSRLHGRQTVLRYQHGALPTVCLYGLLENCDQPLAPHGLTFGLDLLTVMCSVKTEDYVFIVFAFEQTFIAGMA